jgi:hypothetical protein
MQVNAGDTFFLVDPYNHLYIVCSDPAIDPDHVVLVNFTTFKPKEEDCCIVKPGEHPFIRQRSCIRYKDARAPSVNELEVLVEKSLMSPREPVSEDLLARIRSGASKSEYLPEEFRRILEEQSLI